MELIILGLNVVLLMAMWKFIIRRTILDHSRDKLFDLRSELRSTFVQRGWDLGSPAYKTLRDLVNGHLRYTEEMVLSRVIFFTALVKDKQEVQHAMQSRIDSLFSSADAGQRAFIDSFRRRSLAVALEYSVYSSGYFMLLALLITPFVAAGMVMSMINRHVDMTADRCLRYGRHFGKYAVSVLSKSAGWIAKVILVPGAVEAYSYRSGTTTA